MKDHYHGFTPRNRRAGSGRRLTEPVPPFIQDYIRSADAAIAEPYRGITTDRTAVPGLFPIAATGVSTRPVLDAARAFLDALGPGRDAATFPLESDQWRRWSNIHVFTMRHGAMLEELNEAQREAALDLLRVSLSAAGFQTARDIMRLNETIAEVTGKPDELGEWLYWLSIFGTPSESEPWGWQIDGHHLILNCLVLGDQLTMTPAFMGSEPVLAVSGKYKGTRVFESEEAAGLTLAQSLTPAQRAQAVIAEAPPPEVLTTAFRDNMELGYQGIRYDALTAGQQAALRDLLGVYTGRLRPGHAEVRMAEVERHLSETWFAWMGGTDEDAVFYYRVHSPVILVEFDHEAGIAFDNDTPTRNHIHTVVRTPNGNDYGLDLLRQHRALHHARPAAAR